MSSVKFKVSESDINPCPIWNEGTEAQQEFADTLVNNFCKRFTKYLNWALKDELIDETDATTITNDIFFAIDGIGDAKWWCNKKMMDDYKLALMLLDDENDKAIVKKMSKKYNG